MGVGEETSGYWAGIEPSAALPLLGSAGGHSERRCDNAGAHCSSAALVSTQQFCRRLVPALVPPLVYGLIRNMPSQPCVYLSRPAAWKNTLSGLESAKHYIAAKDWLPVQASQDRAERELKKAMVVDSSPQYKSRVFREPASPSVVIGQAVDTKQPPALCSSSIVELKPELPRQSTSRLIQGAYCLWALAVFLWYFWQFFPAISPLLKGILQKSWH
jgi:hypothetical protein